MRNDWNQNCVLVLAIAAAIGLPSATQAQVKVRESAITIPTYTWEDDLNPKFWALEGTGQGSASSINSIIYPYTMQDHLSRTKVDRAYRAFILENEYLKIACLPELGGRLHSVLDKTTGKDMFHLNHVIKPSMIAMRGAWISGGVEWNAGPQGHTVTCVSPVDVLMGQNPDGSAYLEISNLEKSRRTRWTVRVTLRPGRAYLEENIRLFNPTDAMSPYYFWNCVAFPNRPGTRFIFPMTLGTDHSAKTFFTWPMHDGKDLSWLKNYETSSSIFARQCEFDFFGAYDVDADRGIVQTADHHKLSGKKAWTWGNWDFGLVSQKNLTDEDGPYIEVQSGPLPTQSDYGALWPRDEVSWQEWWYPVHGLGEGFEYATRDLAIQTDRQDGRLELRMISTRRFPDARCMIRCNKNVLLEQQVDLTPDGPSSITLVEAPDSPVEIAVMTADDELLASFTSPLPIPKVEAPAAADLALKPDDQLTAEETYLRGRKFDLETNRAKAREYYEKALSQDPGLVRALRGLGVLAVEAGDYAAAVTHLERGLRRDPTDGLSWYFLGVSRLRMGDEPEALRCAYHAARCFGTAALGHGLAGRAYMRQHKSAQAVGAFADALISNPRDSHARNLLLIARYALGDEQMWEEANRATIQSPTDLLPRAVLALRNEDLLQRFGANVRSFVGEVDFEMLETALVFADVGLYREAGRVLEEVCVKAAPDSRRSPLVLYHLAYWASCAGDQDRARTLLNQAGLTSREHEFPSDPAMLPALEYAVEKQPDDASAHLHLGNLYGHLGRLDAAVAHWKKAASQNPSLSIAWRNLGLHSRMAEHDLSQAADYYKHAIEARPSDQTLYRDLAEILIDDGRRPEAIRLLESKPEKHRRADVIILLAKAYLDEKRFDDAIRLLESTPYFVAWEGQTATWVLFNRAHLERGQARLAQGDAEAALTDFDAAMTYPENLGVGRSNKPEHAPALYWRGKALESLGRIDEARAAWREGAASSEGSPQQNEGRRLCEEHLQ